MPFTISPVLTISWLIVTWAIQTGVDAYFTRGILPEMQRRERVWGWAAVNAVVMFLLVLVFRLTLFPLEELMWLLRDRGIMAAGVLLVVVVYFVWAVPFVLGRGWLMRRWKGEGMSEEKRHDYWGYVWIGSVVTVFFNGFLYVAYTIVLPLMEGVEQQFGG
jgi:hypothetical protein